MAPQVINQGNIEKLLDTEHHNPFEILGCHLMGENEYSIRVFSSTAKEINLLVKGFYAQKVKMREIHEEGLFEATVSSTVRPVYDVEYQDQNGFITSMADAFSFEPMITELDLHLIGEGNHHRIYDVLGASMTEVRGINGVHFAVWAPGVRSVSVIGDFNDWDAQIHPMGARGSTGVWEIFIPGVREYSKYKFSIKTRDGNVLEKADPYSRFAEYRPKTASIVCNLKKYSWGDDEWMEKRKKRVHESSPLLTYEVHLGSWMREFKEGNRQFTFREFAKKLIPYVKEKGFTHIQLMPVCEHPFDGSWGYQVTGYYAVTSRFGTPKEFMYFVDQCHQNDIGVILDIVPGHFPKDPHGLSQFTGEYVYEHPDELRREHPHWGTLIFDYGRNEVRNFLVANPLYWFDRFHIDGIRVDAVASMLYLDYGRENLDYSVNHKGGKENLEAVYFLEQMNKLIHEYYPDTISIAEESTAWPKVSHPVKEGGLGFDFKWNMGWMNDTLKFFSLDPIHREHHQDLITFSISYAYSENFVLVLSHDEVVHGKKSLLNKMPGDLESRFAHLKLLFGYIIGHPGKKLFFMGSEFGQDKEWNHDTSLDWHLLDYPLHRVLQSFTTQLFHLYRNFPCLWEDDQTYGGFEWVDFKDTSQNIISFIRQDKSRENYLLFVMNFAPVAHHDYRIGSPLLCEHTEIFNSDADVFGGENIGNEGVVFAEEVPWQDRDYSITAHLPPLGFVIFQPVEKLDISTSKDDII